MHATFELESDTTLLWVSDPQALPSWRRILRSAPSSAEWSFPAHIGSLCNEPELGGAFVDSTIISAAGRAMASVLQLPNSKTCQRGATLSGHSLSMRPLYTQVAPSSIQCSCQDPTKSTFWLIFDIGTILWCVCLALKKNI
ncbi:hypothetical protein XENOCAPTIV_023575 [Xenoophorus captivus]|uniref:Reverse transcriptase/retrotransposon-derived protein RNase H-like domain-containing protein n=1 Tax=Xenoophorus captivus TaxID=1517983 RepID=A0ABV0RLK2_9TELE